MTDEEKDEIKAAWMNGYSCGQQTPLTRTCPICDVNGSVYTGYDKAMSPPIRIYYCHLCKKEFDVPT